MGDYNTTFMNQILETYKDFKGLNLIVDVGGGHGAVLSIIVSKHPTIKGINFDLTPVIEKAPSYPGIESDTYFVYQLLTLHLLRARAPIAYSLQLEKNFSSHA